MKSYLFGILVCVLSIPFAQAQNVLTSATISNYGYYVTDLDASDGIEASADFYLLNRHAAVYTLESGEWQDAPSHNGEPVSISTNTVGYGATAAYSLETLHSEGTIGDFPAQYMAVAGMSDYFYLTPRSSFTFFGRAVGSIVMNSDQRGSYALTTVSLTPYMGSQVSFHKQTLPYKGLYEYDDPFQVTIVNDTSETVAAFLMVYAETGGYISAIPEPSAYLLLTIGLAIIIFRRGKIILEL